MELPAVTAMDQQRFEIPDRTEPTGGCQGDEGRAHSRSTGIRRHTFLAQFLDDGGRRKTQLRQTIAVELDENGLAALAEGGDLADILHQQQLAS
ncbi:hypothetical protein D9M68_868950 [compost metagenome]